MKAKNVSKGDFLAYCKKYRIRRAATLFKEFLKANPEFDKKEKAFEFQGKAGLIRIELWNWPKFNNVTFIGFEGYNFNCK